MEGLIKKKFGIFIIDNSQSDLPEKVSLLQKEEFDTEEDAIRNSIPYILNKQKVMINPIWSLI